MKESLLSLLIALCVIIGVGFFCSCNVTRTVTTKAEYFKNGDTTVQVVTRTTESYDGSVKPSNFIK